MRGEIFLYIIQYVYIHHIKLWTTIWHKAPLNQFYFNVDSRYSDKESSPFHSMVWNMNRSYAVCLKGTSLISPCPFAHALLYRQVHSRPKLTHTQLPLPVLSNLFNHIQQHIAHSILIFLVQWTNFKGVWIFGHFWSGVWILSKTGLKLE